MSGRKLTPAEIHEARKVFGNRIDYHRPRIIPVRHRLALRSNQVLAPDGNIYWADAPENLADETQIPRLATFIHEMAHVMQFQCGVSVLVRGCVLHALRICSGGRFNPYGYRFDDARSYRSYNIEQQAEIAVGIYFGWYPNVIDYRRRSL
jgi:hypothetical protein